MVKNVVKKGVVYVQCEACLFYYKTKDLAQQCEEFCNKHKSCSVEITKHAVEVL